MEANIDLIKETKNILLVRYPRFGSEIATVNIEYRNNLKYHTAATDGKNVYFDPEYLAGLSEDDRLFLIAHEVLHIKFEHFRRQLDKHGQKRDMDVWNQATDAVINANLERDGFKIKEGYVNRPEALKYSCEEFYEILLKEKQAKQNSDGQGGNGGTPDKSNQTNEDNKYIGDDHSLWEEAFQNEERENDSHSDNQKKSIDETHEFSENRKQRKEIARENLKRLREEALKNLNTKTSSQQINLGSVGESSKSLDWRLLLRREIEKSETIWSQRRSIAENNYAYRLEENDIEDEAETEVMIDVSGSVDLNLVKAFLRMLKPLLKQSKLRVGCFNEKYWGMHEIKSTYDIDNFTIPSEARGNSARTEDWDLAVRSFTKKREINKIVFTDGYPCPGTMPKEDLRNENVIWIVYGNKFFKPCCGKVIHITEEYLQILQAKTYIINPSISRKGR